MELIHVLVVQVVYLDAGDGLFKNASNDQICLKGLIRHEYQFLNNKQHFLLILKKFFIFGVPFTRATNLCLICE